MNFLFADVIKPHQWMKCTVEIAEIETMSSYFYSHTDVNNHSKEE